MTTLYLSPRHTDDSQLIWKAAIKLGWEMQRLTWVLLKKLEPGSVTNRVIYGEGSFVATAAEKLKIQLLSPPDDFLQRLNPNLTKRSINNYRYDDVDWHNIKGPLFVKPVEKGLFPARVYKDPVTEINCLPEGTEVIVSEPVEWDIEFRAFVSGQKVRTIAPYSRKGEVVEQASAKEWEEAEAFANQVAKHCNFPGVVDVGYIVDRGWAVVEGNGAWGSGIYGCCPIEALKVIKESCSDL